MGRKDKDEVRDFSLGISNALFLWFPRCSLMLLCFHLLAKCIREQC